MDLRTLLVLLEYTDRSNDRLLECAAPLGDEQLDRDMQMGPGTIRRVLLHICNGESVWYKRWRDGLGGEHAEPPWPGEAERATVAEIGARIAANRAERDAFLARLVAARHDLSKEQVYRDSKGRLFRATLGQMIVQAIMHSKHHQAQAVNMLRRARGDGGWPELDYMYRARRPLE